MKKFEVIFYEKQNGECPVEDFLLSLDSKTSNHLVRVLYFFCFGKKIVLTNGFLKKTPKTPRKEIELAIVRKCDYMERMEKDENATEF